MTKTAELTGRTFEALCADVKVEPTYTGRRTNGDKWEHDTWDVTLTYKGRTYQDISYRMGIGHSPQPPNSYAQPERAAFYRMRGKGGNWNPTPPTAADLISSLLLDVSGLDRGFEGWAADFGMNTDSRKAETMYKACLETLPKLHALLGADFARFETEAQEY